jgi:hypothetical protein
MNYKQLQGTPLYDIFIEARQVIHSFFVFDADQRVHLQTLLAKFVNIGINHFVLRSDAYFIFVDLAKKLVAQKITFTKTRRSSTRVSVVTSHKHTLESTLQEVSEFVEQHHPFVVVGNKYLMNPYLDRMEYVMLFKKEDQFIYIIGEQHGPHTKCHSISKAILMLKEDAAKFSPSPVIDLMIEVSQYESKVKQFEENSSKQQITLLARSFKRCFKNKDDPSCAPFRVHWIDPTQFESPQHRFPSWLSTLYDVALFQITQSYPTFGDLQAWKDTPIRDVLVNEESLERILTDNPVIMKEIRKAESVNPFFTVSFCVRKYKSFIRIYKDDPDWGRGDWKNLPQIILRWTIDIYTVARIIKSNMKHVILYVGMEHSININSILSVLGYDIAHEVKGICLDDKPHGVPPEATPFDPLPEHPSEGKLRKTRKHKIRKHKPLKIQ